MLRVAAIVPIKSFRTAKGRLRSTLGDAGATELATKLARGVITALAPLPVLVVSDDDEVARFARSLGAHVLHQQREGLNGAVSEAYELTSETADYVVIAHSDLAHPEGLGTYPYEDGVTIWTDHTETGTNVLCLPTGLNFSFSYGPHSAPAHRSAARSLGIEPRWMTASAWSLDIDEPVDLEK